MYTCRLNRTSEDIEASFVGAESKDEAFTFAYSADAGASVGACRAYCLSSSNAAFPSALGNVDSSAGNDRVEGELRSTRSADGEGGISFAELNGTSYAATYFLVLARQSLRRGQERTRQNGYVGVMGDKLAALDSVVISRHSGGCIHVRINTCGSSNCIWVDTGIGSVLNAWCR